MLSFLDVPFFLGIGIALMGIILIATPLVKLLRRRRPRW